MDPGTLALINGLGSAAGSIFGSIQGQNQLDWLKNAMNMVYQRANQGDTEARDIWWQIAGPLMQRNDELSNLFLRSIVDQSPYVQAEWEALSPQIKQNFAGSLGRIDSPELQGALSRLSGGADGLDSLGSTANQLFQGGGWTPQYQDLFDTLGPYTQGRGSNAQLALGDVGPNLIGQRGQTALTQGFADRALQASESGGRNPELNAALQFALQELGAGGTTPENKLGQDIGLNTLLSGGQTPESQYLSGRGAELAGIDALLPMGQVRSMARDEAVTSLTDQAKAARRQLLSRGAGVFQNTGLVGDEYGDIGNDIGGKVAQSVNQATREQQGLQQQQQQIGLGAVGQGLSGANTRFGQGADLLASGQGASNQRFLGSLSAIPGTQNAATGLLSTYLQGGLGAGSLENDRMQTGLGMSNALNQSQLGFGNLFSNTMANQNQYALGGGQLANATAGTQGGLNQNFLQGIMSKMQMGISLSAQENAQLMEALGGRTGLWNSNVQGAQGQMGLAGDLAQGQNQLRQGAMGLMNPFASIGYNNPYSNLAQGLSQFGSGGK